MSFPRTSRRRVLGALAGATFAAPTLKFLTRTAEAQTFPTRFVFVYSGAGRSKESRCSGSGASFTFGSGYAPLEPMRRKLSVVEGLDIPDHLDVEEHHAGRVALLTGWFTAEPRAKARGISIDRYLANKLTNGSSVYAGIQQPEYSNEGGYLPLSWHGANAWNTDFTNGAAGLVKRFFAGMPMAARVTAATATTAGRPQDVALYDFLMKEVERLNRVAPRSEAEKLQLHLQTLQQLRAELQPATTPGGSVTPPPPLSGCSPPPAATAPREANDAKAIIERERVLNDQMGVALAHALACGRTRIAVMSYGDDNPHHDWSHAVPGEAGYAHLLDIDRAEAQSFAAFLAKLDSFKEGSGTLLDNTIVVWSSEVSGTYGLDLHSPRQMPVIIAGGGGKLKLGQRIVTSGRTNADLFKAIAMAMGVANPTDYGEARFSKGPLMDVLA